MAKAGKKGAKKSEKKGEKKPVSQLSKKLKGNKTRRTFNSNIKAVAGKKKLSGKSVKVLNSFVFDLLDRIAATAAGVARVAGKQTLNAAAAQAAVRMVLPADLARHSASEASKAVAAYSKTVVKKPSTKKAPKAPKAPKNAKK